MTSNSGSRRLIERNFEQSFRAELRQNDLGLAVDETKSIGGVLPNTAYTWHLFNGCLANGDSKADNIAILKVLEAMANHAPRTKQ